MNIIKLILFISTIALLIGCQSTTVNPSSNSENHPTTAVTSNDKTIIPNSEATSSPTVQSKEESKAAQADSQNQIQSEIKTNVIQPENTQKAASLDLPQVKIDSNFVGKTMADVKHEIEVGRYGNSSTVILKVTTGLLGVGANFPHVELKSNDNVFTTISTKGGSNNTDFFVVRNNKIIVHVKRLPSSTKLVDFLPSDILEIKPKGEKYGNLTDFQWQAPSCIISILAIPNEQQWTFSIGITILLISPDVYSSDVNASNAAFKELEQKNKEELEKFRAEAKANAGKAEAEKKQLREKSYCSNEAQSIVSRIRGRNNYENIIRNDSTKNENGLLQCRIGLTNGEQLSNGKLKVVFELDVRSDGKVRNVNFDGDWESAETFKLIETTGDKQDKK